MVFPFANNHEERNLGRSLNRGVHPCPRAQKHIAKARQIKRQNGPPIYFVRIPFIASVSPAMKSKNAATRAVLR